MRPAGSVGPHDEALASRDAIIATREELQSPVDPHFAREPPSDGVIHSIPSQEESLSNPSSPSHVTLSRRVFVRLEPRVLQLDELDELENDKQQQISLNATSGKVLKRGPRRLLRLLVRN